MRIFLALLTICLPFAAHAQQGQCAPRDRVVAHLAAKYSETRRSVGLAANNMVLEVFASEETGSWTITVTSAQGITCLVASGQNFQAVQDDPPATGSPA